MRHGHKTKSAKVSVWNEDGWSVLHSFMDHIQKTWAISTRIYPNFGECQSVLSSLFLFTVILVLKRKNSGEKTMNDGFDLKHLLSVAEQLKPEISDSKQSWPFNQTQFSLLCCPFLLEYLEWPALFKIYRKGFFFNPFV